ncbi:hypothetical protein F5Y18DRAFT_429142 [Xylariaceae sp. FL1019]|nr:hypothetical protein F5Y18DRAFT_429142 [Xylariaceae sp. FL1019]
MTRSTIRRVTIQDILAYEQATPRSEDFRFIGRGNRPLGVVVQHFDNEQKGACFSVQIGRVHPNLPKCRMALYVDGSWRDSYGGNAVFFRIFGVPGVDSCWERCLGGMEGTDNNGAELYAFSRALRIPLRMFAGAPIKPEIYIMTDSKTVGQQVRRYLRNDRLILLKGISVAESAALLSPLRDLNREDMSPVITYSPAHCDIWGNEEADKYAKRGRKRLEVLNSSLVTQTGRYQVFSEDCMEQALKRISRLHRTIGRPSSGRNGSNRPPGPRQHQLPKPPSGLMHPLPAKPAPAQAMPHSRASALLSKPSAPHRPGRHVPLTSTQRPPLKRQRQSEAGDEPAPKKREVGMGEGAPTDSQTQLQSETSK